MPSAGPRVKKLRSPRALSVSCPGDSLNVNLCHDRGFLSTLISYRHRGRIITALPLKSGTAQSSQALPLQQDLRYQCAHGYMTHHDQDRESSCSGTATVQAA